MLSEFQLFVILLLCVVLRASKNGLGVEYLQQGGYGVCQLIATVAIVPVTLYTIRMRVLDLEQRTAAVRSTSIF